VSGGVFWFLGGASWRGGSWVILGGVSDFGVECLGVGCAELRSDGADEGTAGDGGWEVSGMGEGRH
jgi:hypothetical protein